jgi:hypothetical protein
MRASESRAATLERINGETAKIAWVELQRFFAQGKAVLVAAQLDLVNVACEFSMDNAEQVEAWMASGDVVIVSDAQAEEWLTANALLWAVVVRPWVLVQPILQSA